MSQGSGSNKGVQTKAGGLTSTSSCFIPSKHVKMYILTIPSKLSHSGMCVIYKVIQLQVESSAMLELIQNKHPPGSHVLKMLIPSNTNINLTFLSFSNFQQSAIPCHCDQFGLNGASDVESVHRWNIQTRSDKLPTTKN